MINEKILNDKSLAQRLNVLKQSMDTLPRTNKKTPTEKGGCAIERLRGFPEGRQQGHGIGGSRKGCSIR